MATTTGVAVQWGIPSARQAGTGYETTGARYSNEGESKELKDDAGETKTVITWDKKQSLELEVYPAGVTLGTLPDFGSTVLVNSVSYMYMGGDENSGNESEQKMTFRLKKWGTNITL